MVKYDPSERITFKELYNTSIFNDLEVGAIYIRADGKRSS